MSKNIEKFLNIENKFHYGCISILRRLFNQHRIGGKHLPESICLRWIKHLPKQEHSQAIKDWEKCIKEELVLTKPKPSERHVFLNQRKLKEIRELIE